MKDADSLESNFSYFSDKLCDRADDALRLAYLLSLDLVAAHKLINDVYQGLAENLVLAVSEDNVTKLLVKELWLEFAKDGKTNPDSGNLANVFKVFFFGSKSSNWCC